MNQYNIIVQQLLVYLTKRKQCSSSRMFHKQCYEKFGQYLEKNNLYLSQETAEQWIASIQGKYNRQKCYFWQQYISQLGNVSLNGYFLCGCPAALVLIIAFSVCI